MEDSLNLEIRTGLPEALRVLARDYPRDLWESHRNFDALTRFWLERHAMFRQVLARLEDDAQHALNRDIDARRYGTNTSRLTGFLLDQLHGHHQIEDTAYFPQLARLDTRLVAGFDLLDADHHALDGHIAALGAGTGTMLAALDSGGDSRAAVGGLLTQTQAFARFIDRHLVDEEDLVIPTILHYAPDL